MALESRIFTYEAELEWRGGRRAAVTAGNHPALDVQPPPEFPAGDETSWSPEHLFLASIQSCTMLSFVAHCAHRGARDRELPLEAADGVALAERRSPVCLPDASRWTSTCGCRAARPEPARELTAKAERDCFISASTTADGLDRLEDHRVTAVRCAVDGGGGGGRCAGLRRGGRGRRPGRPRRRAADLAFVFVSAEHAAEAEQVAAEVATVLSTRRARGRQHRGGDRRAGVSRGPSGGERARGVARVGDGPRAPHRRGRRRACSSWPGRP